MRASRRQAHNLILVAVLVDLDKACTRALAADKMYIRWCPTPGRPARCSPEGLVRNLVQRKYILILPVRENMLQHQRTSVLLVQDQSVPKLDGPPSIEVQIENSAVVAARTRFTTEGPVEVGGEDVTRASEA